MTIPLIVAMLLFSRPQGSPDAAPPPQDDLRVTVEAGAGSSGWLGVSIRDMNDEIAKELGSAATEGALVDEVTADSPADTAGLKRKDVIVEFGGRKIYDADDLRKTVRRMKPGEEAAVTVDRGGQSITLRVRVGSMPRSFSSYGWAPKAPRPPVPPRAPRVFMFRRGGELGLRVRSVEGQLAAYFGAPEKGAVLVEEVESNGAGRKAGFKAGDVIVKAGGKGVEDVGDIQAALEGKEKGDKVAFEVIRKGSRKTVTATMEESAVSHRMHVAPPGMHEFRWEGPGEFEFEFDDQQMRELDESIRIELERARPEMDRAREEMRKAGKELKEQGEKMKKELRKIRIERGGSVRT
jgi:membrane-associated protease RseP (regulator of RpoE activity)